MPAIAVRRPRRPTSRCRRANRSASPSAARPSAKPTIRTGCSAACGTTPTRAPSTPSASTGSARPPQSRAQPAARERRTGMPRLIGGLFDCDRAREISPPSGARQAIVAKGLAQRRLLDLAGRRVRDLVDEDHVVRQPPFGDLRPDEVEHLLARRAASLLGDDDQQRPLVPFRMAARRSPPPRRRRDGRPRGFPARSRKSTRRPT